MFLPTKLFFTKGVGRHKEYLQSFELALRDAKIETREKLSLTNKNKKRTIEQNNETSKRVFK